MALPNSNISTTLIGNTIGSSSRDVGTLCTHPNINKWSKWKPLKIATVTGIDEVSIKASKSGFQINEFTTLHDLYMFYYGQGGTPYKFAYIKPSGGSASPYRLGDFRTYEHSAVKCYNIGGLGDWYSPLDAKITVEFTIPTLSQWNVNFDSLGMENAFIGVLVVSKIRGMNSYATGISSTNIINPPTGGVWKIDVSVNALSDDTYEVFAFLATSPNNQNTSINKWYPIEDGYLGDVVYSSVPPYEISINGSLVANGATHWDVPFTIVVRNNTSSPITLSNCMVHLRYKGKSITDPLLDGEMARPIGNTSGTISLAANGGEYNEYSTVHFVMLLESIAAHGGASIWFNNTTELALNKEFPLTYP